MIPVMFCVFGLFTDSKNEVDILFCDWHGGYSVPNKRHGTLIRHTSMENSFSALSVENSFSAFSVEN